MSKCKLQKGDVSILIEENLQDASGHSWPDGWTVSCKVEVGTILRIPYEPQVNRVQEKKELSKPTPKLPKSSDKSISSKKKTQIVKYKKGPKKQKESREPKPIITSVTTPTPVKENLITLTEEKNEEKKEGGENMPKSNSQLIATVQQPAPDAVSQDLMKIAKDNATDPTVAIILAALAVFGGGAAFKFYRQWSEQKHEEKMAKIKIESKGQDKSPGQCQAVHAQLTADLAEVKSRVGTLENKISVDADFDGERLEKRVKKLEKWKKESEE